MGESKTPGENDESVCFVLECGVNVKDDRRLVCLGVGAIGGRPEATGDRGMESLVAFSQHAADSIDPSA